MSEGRRIEVGAPLKPSACALLRWIVSLTLSSALLPWGVLERIASAQSVADESPERVEDADRPRSDPPPEDAADQNEADRLEPEPEHLEEARFSELHADEPTITIIDERDYGFPRPERRLLGLLSQLQLGLPFMMSEDAVRRDPGANLSARFALTSRYIGGGFQGGYQWIPGDDRNEQTGATLGRAFFGPFMHLQFPTRSVLTPYGQLGVDFNYWNRSERERYCDPFQCFTTRVYRFTPGLHGRLGGMIAFGRKERVDVDLGLEANLSFRGSYFSSNEWFLMPYLGFLFLH